MKKRALLFVCVLALLIGCMAISALAASTEHTAYCAYCMTDDVVWEKIQFSIAPATGETSCHKHYYLDKSYTDTEAKQLSVRAGATACIDLNGYSYETSGRAIYISGTTTAPAVLNIMDTKGGGYFQGSSAGNNPGGGTLYVAINKNVNDATVNIYSGTLKFMKIEDAPGTGTGKGAVASVNGTLNMYGGTIEGGEVVDSTYESFNTLDAVGGAICLEGKLNVYGGEITAGAVPDNGAGPCVYVNTNTASAVYLGGDGEVEDIYFPCDSSKKLTVADDFKGVAGLSYAPEVALRQCLQVGVCDATTWEGTITCTDDCYGFALPSQGGLILSAYEVGTAAAVDGTPYTSLPAAVQAVTKNNMLVELVQSYEGDITFNKNVYLQLNGCSIDGTVTVANGCTLYGMDSATEDFTVADGKYGKLKVDGAYVGASIDAEKSDDSYIAVTKGDQVSFHCVRLQIYAMTLRVAEFENNPGLFYKSHFLADEMAAPLLTQHGVALSITHTPDASNIKKYCQYSTISGFESGPSGNLGNASSTLLKGIMKAGNGAQKNEKNLNTDVWGRAYAKTADGQYIFGKAVKRSLQEQLTAVDAMAKTGKLSKVQTKAVADLYQQYKANGLENCSLPNIKEAAENNEKGTLKVLVLGNSHGLDATNLLAEVFYQERVAGNHDQDVLIAALYYSGCRVEQHYNFLSGNKNVYTYHKNYATTAGESWVVKNATCLDALRDEQWDIILMQQMNTYAAQEEHYNAEHWKYVADYLRNNQDNAPVLGFHMTWANPDDPTLAATGSASFQQTHIDNFSVDGKYEQDVMYEKIMQLTQKYIVDSTDWLGKDYFDERYIMNSATAVHYAQNVRGRIHNNIYRDYTHMNDYGRLICAYQWYAQLMGIEQLSEEDVNVSQIPSALQHKNNNFAKDGIITKDMKEDLIASVNWALKNPFSLPEQTAE